MKIKIITPAQGIQYIADDIIDFIHLDYSNVLLKFSDGSLPAFVAQYHFDCNKKILNLQDEDTDFHYISAFIIFEKDSLFCRHPFSTIFEIIVVAPNETIGKSFIEKSYNHNFSRVYYRIWKDNIVDWWFTDNHEFTEYELEYIEAIKKQYNYHLLEEIPNYVIQTVYDI